MWQVSQKHGLDLQRKYIHLSEQKNTYNDLLEKFDLLNIDHGVLQEMVYQFRQYDLKKIFTTTKVAFQKVIYDWEIKLPPNGYWKRSDN